MSLMDKIKAKLNEKVEDTQKDLDTEIEKLDEKVDPKTEEVVDEAETVDKEIDEADMKKYDEKKDKKDDMNKDKKDDSMDKDEEEIDDEKDGDAKVEINVKESLQKIFSDVKLDEGLIEDLTTLFIASVDEKVSKIKEGIQSEMDAELEEALAEIEENINKYVSYVAEEWYNDNEIALDAGIKVELAENFLSGMRDLFTENYVEVPDDKIDLVAEAEETIDELSTKLDESENEKLELQKELNTIKAKKIVDEVASEMTETQKEKFAGLLDSIDYKDDDSYKKKISLVAEKFFDKKNDEETLDEEAKVDEKSDKMARYKSALRTSKI